MKQKVRFCLLAFLGIVLLITCAPGCSPSKQQVGNGVIEKIEAHRKANGRWPHSLSELGVAEDESGPVYYCKTTQTEYIVWYGTALGESVTYSSRTKQWKQASGETCLNEPRTQ